MKSERKNKEERLEDALLEYIERHAKDAQPGTLETIPAAADRKSTRLNSSHRP